MTGIRNKKVAVDGLNVFYREAGSAQSPTLLLLHGFPSSSHMFRDLIPLLSDKYHLVAPDLPGFGRTDMPSRDSFQYTFENLAKVIGRFTEVIGLERFGIYVFDYGAPVGLRMAVNHPERIATIITQNGNAYLEGLSDGWIPTRNYWNEPTQENRDALRQLLTFETTYWQYTYGAPDAELISPDGYSLDHYYLKRPGADEIQLDLFLNYASNLNMYPVFQEYFRDYQPEFLAVWGRNDPFFLPEGALAYKRDIKDANVMFFEAGHFALETHAAEIAKAIKESITVPPAELTALPRS